MTFPRKHIPWESFLSWLGKSSILASFRTSSCIRMEENTNENLTTSDIFGQEEKDMRWLFKYKYQELDLFIKHCKNKKTILPNLWGTSKWKDKSPKLSLWEMWKKIGLILDLDNKSRRPQDIRNECSAKPKLSSWKSKQGKQEPSNNSDKNFLVYSKQKYSNNSNKDTCITHLSCLYPNQWKYWMLFILLP